MSFFPKVRDWFRAHLGEDVNPFSDKMWMEGVEEAVSGRRTSLSLLVFADLQPIAQAAGPSQLAACGRLFDEMAASVPEADGAIIAGDIGHRGGVDAGQINALKAVGFPGAAALKPGDAYPWGPRVVLDEFVQRTRISLSRVLTIPGNHEVSGRGNGKNPTGWTYRHYRDDLGSPYYWSRFGNVAVMCLGTEGGWIGGQIAAEVIAWAERVIASNQNLHWHLALHHPPVGYGPTEPDMTWLPEVAITSGHVSAYAASGTLTLTIGAYNYRSMQKTPVFLGGKMLLVGRDYEYFEPPSGADGEATGDEDNPPEAGALPGYGEHTQITLLPTLAHNLAAGQKLRAGVVASVEARQDAWTTHMLVGTVEDPGLLRKFAPQGHSGPGRIRLCLWGHTGTIHNAAQRHSWVDPETGVRFAGLNMALNAQVAAGLGPANPLVYAVASWSTTTNSLSFQYRNATATIRPDGSFSGAPLAETHGVDRDFTLVYPTPLDLGDGGLTRDGRTLDGGHLVYSSTLWRGDLADMESRRRPTGAVDPVTGFSLNDKAASGFLTVGVYDLTDASLSDSKPGDGFGWHVRMPSGLSSNVGGYVPYTGDASSHVLTFGFERSRDAEALPHAVAFWRARLLSGEWKDLLRLNGETGLVEIPQGVADRLVVEHRPAAFGGVTAPPQIVHEIRMIEGDRDLAVDEERRMVFSMRLTGDAEAVPQWGLASRRISALDSVRTEEPSIVVSWVGDGVMERVWRLDMAAKRHKFLFPVDLPAGSVLAGYPTDASHTALVGRVTTLEGETRPVARGGTGAATAATARTNLGAASAAELTGYAANGLVGRGALVAPAHMDTTLTPGVYGVASAGVAAAVGAPEPGWSGGVLEVMPTGAAGYEVQRYTVRDPGGAGAPRIWLRRASAGVWGAWHETLTSGSVRASVSAAPAFVGQTAVVGGTPHLATGTASPASWFALAPALRSYTVATLPSASPAMQTAYVSNGAGNRRFAVSDGTNWRWPDGAVVS